MTLSICITDKAKGARPCEIPTKFDEESIAVTVPVTSRSEVAVSLLLLLLVHRCQLVRTISVSTGGVELDIPGLSCYNGADMDRQRDQTRLHSNLTLAFRLVHLRPSMIIADQPMSERRCSCAYAPAQTLVPPPRVLS
jgi:hypothetical protein